MFLKAKIKNICYSHSETLKDSDNSLETEYFRLWEGLSTVSAVSPLITPSNSLHALSSVSFKSQFLEGTPPPVSITKPHMKFLGITYSLDLCNNAYKYL